MVQEHRGEYPSLWAAIGSKAPKIGCAPQTLNDGVKHDQFDKGEREGLVVDVSWQEASSDGVGE
jgi:transposase